MSAWSSASAPVELIPGSWLGALGAIRAIGATARLVGGAHLGEASAAAMLTVADMTGNSAGGGTGPLSTSPFALASKSEASIPSAPASASCTAADGSLWPDSIAERYE